MNNLDKLIILIYIKSKLELFHKKPKNIFLGGSAWGSAFYIGVYQGLLEKYENLNDINFYSVSAGSLLALCMILRMSPDEITKIYLDLANQANKEGVFLKMTKYHNLALDKILKNDEDYKKVNGKLNIGISIYPDQHLIVNNWNSNEELRHDLHCTFSLPYYTTYNALKNNKLALDGAITFNQKFYPNNILYIGMINCHINGNLSTKECTYPILGDKLNNLILDGYNKIKNYNFDYIDTDVKIKGGFLLPKKLWWLLKLSTNFFIKNKFY